MRLTPLSQEVRRTSFRAPKSDAHSRANLRWFVLAAVYLATVVLTSPFYLYKPPASERAIDFEQLPLRAQVDFRYVSEEAQREYESERRRFHKRVYDYRAEVYNRVRGGLDELYLAVAALNPGEDSAEHMLNVLRRTSHQFNFLTEADVAEFVQIVKNPRFRQAIDSIVNEAYLNHVVVRQMTMYEGFRQDRVLEVHDPMSELSNRREVLDNPLPYPPEDFAWNPLYQRLHAAYGRSMSPAVEETAELVLRTVIEPNLVYNEAATRLAYENYPRRDLSRLYARDSLLLTREQFSDGGMASGELQEKLAVLGAHRAAVERSHNIRLGGHAAFVLIVFVILSFYIRRFSRSFAITTYNIMLVSLPVLIALAVEAVIILLADGDSSTVGYLFPAGAIGLLGVLLLDMRMALLLVTWGCLLAGLQADLNYEFVVVGLFGGYTAVAALAHIRKRWEVFLASIYIGLANAAVIIITGFIRDLDAVPLDLAGLGFFSGIASFLVLAILPVFERFGIITDMQLLELTGLHHPLLRQIEENAPGTWQHTLNVTKLAEAAATEIGVNYLLVRAGCYYHDIGKVKKPEYFTENQITAEDKARHDGLKPIMSARIIKNHVKEGVEMATAAKLPQQIIDFIPQHHGTHLITYFYNKAAEAHERGESRDPLREEEYRYPGPKPQTIEAAIVMLADSVEATATARITGRTVRPDEIQQLVRNTIFDRFNDGQFTECNLTLRDLNVIRQVFVSVLKSRFHTRIDYPKKGGEQAKEKKEKRSDSGSDDKREKLSSSRTDVEQGPVRSESRSAVMRES